MNICLECGKPASTDWRVIPLEMGGRATVPLCDEHAAIAADVRGLAVRLATRTGQERARAAGVHMGRPRRLSDDALERLRVLRGQGTSYRAIARIMNEEGIPGGHGGRWHESSVRSALRRYGA